MIVVVIIVEKEERKKIQFAQKTVLGYDTQKWVEADALIRDEDKLEVSYQKVNFVTATKGNHRFAKWQKQYEDGHNFLSCRNWAPVQSETDVSGITWIELFVLFDISGARSADAMHQKNPSATARAAKRKAAQRQAKGKNGKSQSSTAEAKPTLDEELKLFKAMVRHITKIETRSNGKWFQADSRPKLRRLGNLAVNGHQPAIAAYCELNKKGKEEIGNAILKQKVANNAKAEKQLLEHRERAKQDNESKIRIRIARIVAGAAVR